MALHSFFEEGVVSIKPPLRRVGWEVGKIFDDETETISSSRRMRTASMKLEYTDLRDFLGKRGGVDEEG